MAQEEKEKLRMEKIKQEVQTCVACRYILPLVNNLYSFVYHQALLRYQHQNCFPVPNNRRLPVEINGSRCKGCPHQPRQFCHEPHLPHILAGNLFDPENIYELESVKLELSGDRVVVSGTDSNGEAVVSYEVRTHSSLKLHFGHDVKVLDKVVVEGQVIRIAMGEDGARIVDNMTRKEIAILAPDGTQEIIVALEPKTSLHFWKCRCISSACGTDHRIMLSDDEWNQLQQQLPPQNTALWKTIEQTVNKALPYSRASGDISRGMYFAHHTHDPLEGYDVAPDLRLRRLKIAKYICAHVRVEGSVNGRQEEWIEGKELQGMQCPDCHKPFIEHEMFTKDEVIVAEPESFGGAEIIAYTYMPHKFIKHDDRLGPPRLMEVYTKPTLLVVPMVPNDENADVEEDVQNEEGVDKDEDVDQVAINCQKIPMAYYCCKGIAARDLICPHCNKHFEEHKFYYRQDVPIVDLQPEEKHKVRKFRHAIPPPDVLADLERTAKISNFYYLVNDKDVTRLYVPKVYVLNAFGDNDGAYGNDDNEADNMNGANDHDS